jgi:hypothetical protein
MRVSRPTLGLTLLLVAAVALFPSRAIAGSLPDFDARIKKGSHDDTNLWGPRCLNLSTRTDRTVTFRAQFTASCRYRTTSSQNQLDWNKLMGITTARIHHNSIRLGWRYNPTTDKIDLGFYGYAKGARIMQPITSIDIGAWADVRLRMHRNGLEVEVNGQKHVENRALGLSSIFPTPTWVLRTAYFGGDETAPQDMLILVRSIRTS